MAIVVRLAGGQEPEGLGAEDEHELLPRAGRPGGGDGDPQTASGDGDELARPGVDDRGAQEVGVPEEVRHEGIHRPRVELRRIRHLLEAPLVQDGDAVRHGHRLVLVVGDVERRDVETPLDVADLFLHVGAELPVERAQGLVHEEGRGIEDQGAGQGHALLLAAAQLARAPGREPREADELEHPLDAGPDLDAGHPAKAEREGDVVEHAQVGEEGVVLEDDPEIPFVRGAQDDGCPIDPDVAAGRHEEPGQHHEKRRLARSARPEQRDELTLGDAEAHVPDGDHVAECPGDREKLDLGARIAAHESSVPPALRTTHRASLSTGTAWMNPSATPSPEGGG